MLSLRVPITSKAAATVRVGARSILRGSVDLAPAESAFLSGYFLEFTTPTEPTDSRVYGRMNWTIFGLTLMDSRSNCSSTYGHTEPD